MRARRARRRALDRRRRPHPNRGVTAHRGLRLDPSRRLRLLPLLERNHRRAEGRRPPAARHVDLLRDLREARSSASAPTIAASAWRSSSSPTGSATRSYFPFHVGATAVLFSRAPHAGGSLRADRAPPADASSSAFPRPTRACSRRWSLPAGCELRRRNFASVRACASAPEQVAPRSVLERWRARTGPRDPRRDRLDRDLPHLPVEPPGTCERAPRGCPVPGYDLRLVDEDGDEYAARRPRRLCSCGATPPPALLEQARATKQGRSTASGSARATSYWQDEVGYFFHGGGVGRRGSRREASGSLPSRSRRRSSRTPRCSSVPSSGRRTRRARETARVRHGARHGRGSRTGLARGELRAFARRRSQRTSARGESAFVAELPKTATGKIQRFLLRRR